MSDRGKTIAPGQPGITPRWTSSAKSGVGTALGPRSRVWYTISHGILNEVYYPHIDRANTRDLGLIVTDTQGWFSEEKRQTASVVTTLAPGVPGYRVVNTCIEGRYRITKIIIADPERDVVLQHMRFEALRGRRTDYRLFALLAPHLANQGEHNSGRAGDYKGMPALFAKRDGRALAMASSVGFAAMSCGYVGVSDGWQQLRGDGRLVECYPDAPDGNIALTGQVDLEANDGSFVLALAFGYTDDDAGNNARASLLGDFDATCDAFVDDWKRFHARSRTRFEVDDEYQLSVAVLQTHEDKSHRGGLIASLSIPWGQCKGDHDLGGYHVVWPRDLVESASALLAAGHADAARNALQYLMVTQEADGHWPQNMWLDGRRYWTGNQLDETAFPILLADHLRRTRALVSLNVWPMVRRAAAYVVRNGPVTPEDRWEEDGGYSSFTLAALIAGLLAAADFADIADEPVAAAYLRETADAWYADIDRWTYVEHTSLAESVGVDGYYVRIAPCDVTDPNTGHPHLIAIKNQPAEAARVDYESVVSPDALQLVRFGLRAAGDQRILNTVRVIDAVLCTRTPTGPVWHRYNHDGYGEHADGKAYDGTGIGRGWPLLAGERGHYEVAAGNLDGARELLDVIRRQTNCGMIPEQVWDAADIPERELAKGHPSGSAMPLAWAHAEYVKLVRSIHDRRVFDMPPQTRARYLESSPANPFALWRFNNKPRVVTEGKTLRIEAGARHVVHWSADAWQHTADTQARDTTLGMWVTDLPTKALAAGTTLVFTFFWTDAGHWEGTDFSVVVTPSAARQSARRDG
jgi:glucoamylase